MEILDSLLLGTLSAFTFKNLIWCFAGVFLGTLVGVLPGLGPFAAISMLLPLTYHLDPITGIIFLAGLYYGTQYGGSTTSILLNLPGESSSVVTCTDGYQMTKKGRGGAALSIAAIASFIAGIVATTMIIAIGIPLSKLALKFGPAEYTSLMLLGLLVASVLSKSSFSKSFSMVLIGILIGIVGIDINSGIERFTFNVPNLYNGISFAIIAMGMFGLSEILYNILHEKENKFKPPTIKELYPNKQEIKDSTPAILRGTMLGAILGVLPGAGAIISSFASYSLEKKISKNPEKFGTGAIEGVAGPEASNNAAAQTSFIPMLTLGIPFTPVMALLIAALTIHDIQPGPQIISNNGVLFWALIVSMLVGNFMLVILNVPLIGIWIKVISIPRKILYPLIIVICIIGAYYINNSWFDPLLLIPFTVIGYYFKKWKCDPAPLAKGFVLGPLLEEYFRRTMMISDGSFMIFLEKPLSLTFIIISTALILLSYKKLKTY
jgi:TctA family transporter